MAACGVGGVDVRTIKMVFSKLVDGLKATDIIDDLFEKDLLILDEYTGILEACSQSLTRENSRNVNRRVLTAILRRPPGFVATLVAILRKKDRSLANALENALTEVSGHHQPEPAPTQQFTQDVQPSSSGVTAGPMSEWNINALVALKGKLKLNVRMIQLVDILQTAAGGFMNSAEAQSVRAKIGDVQQIEEVIDVLQGKGDKEFAIFCQMLRQCNYQMWARQLELEAKKFRTDALPSTDPPPSQGSPQAVMSMSAPTPGPSKEGRVPSQSANSTTHPISPTLNNMCWPEFPALQDEFSTLVSELSVTLHTLEQPQFERLLVYLRERLRPMVDGCFPTEGSPNVPKGITASELVPHLQDYNYWNYLNTDLVEGIIKCVSVEGSPLASLMAEYKENVRSKVKRTLEECKLKNVKPEPPPHYNIMAVEVNTGGNPLSFHLYQIFQVKNLLVHKFGVKDVLFAGFTEGSIVLYFFIPEEAVYSLCPKLEANCTAMEELHVTTLVVFGHFSVDIGYQQMNLLHKVPPQVGVFPPDVFSGTRPPVSQPSSFQQPVLMEPLGSQTTQAFTRLSREMEVQHQLFMDQYKQLLEEHHQRFEGELIQLHEFKSTLFAELQRYIEPEMKKHRQHRLQFEVPAKFQRIIIGQRGQNLKRVESKTGLFNIKIIPGPSEDIALVTMIGDNRRCEAAKKEILIIVAKTQLSREKKVAILTAVQGDFKLTIAEYKGTLPPTYQHEWRFRRFYYLKLCRPAKAKSAKKEEDGHLGDQAAEFLDWGKLRNYSIVSSRFQKALEEALKPAGSGRLGLEARFGQIFFKADRTLSMDELQAEFLVNNVEKDGLIDVSMPLGSTHWTFVTALPKSMSHTSDLSTLPLVWDFETVDISFTHIPKDPTHPYVHFVLHTYRDNKGNFQFMDMRPKLGKDLVFDCLSLHGHLDMRLVLNTAEELREMDKSAMTRLGKAIAAGLDIQPGVVLLSYQYLKDVDEEFRVSFVRHEVKKMYLDKDDGHCYLVAHCTVEECDTQQSDLGDNPSEFPLGKPHQELELKNCQWLADFYQLMGVNWKTEVSSCGCDVSDIHVVPKPVNAVTVVEELRHFAKYALQIAQDWQVKEE